MEILTHPNPVLSDRAGEIDPATDPGLRSLVRKMAEAMYENQGVGLAAPQVGIQKRVIVFDIDEELGAICNPVITECSEETEVDEEGCLSVPGINVPVERAISVVCEGLNLDGKRIVLEAHDFLARVLQHEIDHLDGVIILDRLTPDQRKAAIREYNNRAAAE
ncbi:MAG: peptide deformylase [Actinobacteria bacterium HGW-Actinobacteria-1]|jgi:peptide deformylase|nr:MAG: peptide deformylase [Actinobacteria bacterium HGW-Actinobacteria-1]